MESLLLFKQENPAAVDVRVCVVLLYNTTIHLYWLLQTYCASSPKPNHHDTKYAIRTIVH